MSEQSEIKDQMVTAESAPIGQLLWPVRDERYAKNFTLMEVAVVRTECVEFVRWTYQNGTTREFKIGEQVACRF